jgi:hypothetical protein
VRSLNASHLNPSMQPYVPQKHCQLIVNTPSSTRQSQPSDAPPSPATRQVFSVAEHKQLTLSQLGSGNCPARTWLDQRLGSDGQASRPMSQW